MCVGVCVRVCMCVCLFLWILHEQSASRLDFPPITWMKLSCKAKSNKDVILQKNQQKKKQSVGLPDDFTSEKGEDTKKISALPFRSCFSWPVSRLDQAAVSLDTRAVGKGALHNWHIFGHFRGQVHYFSHTHTREWKEFSLQSLESISCHSCS